MREWFDDLWEDYSGVIYVSTCVVFVVVLLIFNFGWSLRYQFRDIVTIHEIAQTDKGNWRVMYAEANGRFGASVDEEIFKSYEGAMSFARRYSKDYRED